MRKLIALIVLMTLGAAPASNQAVTFATLVANQSGNFSWVGSAPASTTQALTYSAYKTYVQNQTTTCTVPGLSGTYGMTWNDVISCASTHTASQQSESVSGNYSTVSYTATFNSRTGLYTCNGPFGSNNYYGTPITLPTGTVAPTSSATQLSLTLSGISFPGTSSSITVTLKNPSGGTVYTSPSISSSTYGPINYSASGAPAGAWSWVITQTGGSGGACDSTNGVTVAGGTQAVWSATSQWYQ